MKKLLNVIIFISFMQLMLSQNNSVLGETDRTIFAYGGDINSKFIRYAADLTGKLRPKICYIPTASADNERNIKYWNMICKYLSVEPFVLKVWVDSQTSDKTFEEILLGMDAIVVGGGNTVNMMGIWKAQGIDTVLKKAYNKGIVLSGGSAGGICWFEKGTSDSRPVKLSIADGLELLPYSYCPHYSENRQQFYIDNIKNGKLKDGFASDKLSGILFKNGYPVESVSLNEINNSYYVSKNSDSSEVKKLDSRILINKDAVPLEELKIVEINKKVKEFENIKELSSPLNSFLFVKNIFALGEQAKYKEMASSSIKDRVKDFTNSAVKEDEKEKMLNTDIIKILIYKDMVAGVINKMYDDFYGVWYFYKENGKWLSAGEDIGGDTILQSEILFREEVTVHIKKVNN